MEIFKQEDNPIEDNDNDIWGGYWTERKIEIFIKYLKAYLDIMNKQAFELIYFDGFAGSGQIEGNKKHFSSLESIGMKVLGMQHARKFDLYYLVDLDEKKIKAFEQKAQEKYPELFTPKPKAYLVNADCNVKLTGMCKYMKKAPQKRKALVLVDPFGMQVNWASIEACKGLGIDFWILVPTGLGVNRLLKADGNIREAWKRKLVDFLGLEEPEILDFFYRKRQRNTLFGKEEYTEKEANAAEKAAELYVKRLKTVWKFVSTPMIMKNKMNSVMYHFIFASNNASGLKIANDIMKIQ